MAEHTTSIEIDAAPERVFTYLVTPEGLTTWMGQGAVLEPRPGGVFEVNIAGSPIRGKFLEVDAPYRMVVSWGIAGSDDFPPGTSTVAFTLTPTERGTRVDLSHSGLPEEMLDGHESGWRHFLPRLLIASEGGDPGHDNWLPGQTEGHWTS